MADSLWQWTPEDDRTAVGVMAGGQLPALVWAEEVMPALIALQVQTGIPALGAVAQLLHEAWNPGGVSLSRLASEFYNFGGLKWAEWQRAYGARPVSLATWEEIGGDRVDMVDAFAAFPSFDEFLQAYGALMRFDRYRPALRYASHPLLWLHQVAAAGYATDSRYLAGPGRWMTLVWQIYAGTVSADVPTYEPVDVVDASGRRLADGWLMDPDGVEGPDGQRAVVRVRQLAEALGLAVTYEDRDPAPRVVLTWPGLKA